MGKTDFGKLVLGSLGGVGMARVLGAGGDGPGGSLSFWPWGSDRRGWQCRGRSPLFGWIRPFSEE